MVLTAYIVAFLFSLFCWLFFISFWHKKANIYISLIFCVIAISNGGYLALALSEGKDTALLAQKIIYIAGIFAPLFIFLNIVELCKINLSKIVRALLIMYFAFVYMLVLTIGYSDIYYKRVDMHSIYGVTYIVKEYGTMHSLYSIALYGINLASLFLIIYALTKQKKISYKNSIVLLIVLTLSIGAYMGKKMTGSTVEWMPFAFSLCSLTLIILHRRVDMYDVNLAILDTLEQEKNGYIILNRKFKYIASNDMAHIYFPGLNDMKIDYSVEGDKSLFYNIRKKAEQLEEKKYVSWNKRINNYNIKCELRNVYYDKKKTAYLLELRDDTNQQKYIQSINRYNNELEETINKRSNDIVEIQNKIILGMANVVESRDNSTGGHIKRTSKVVKIFVQKLRSSDVKYDMTEEFCNDVIKAAPMHDLGKISIDDRILRKPGKFTSDEYNEMKRHAKEGSVIIDSVLEGVEDESFVRVANNMACYHHEKYNGQGYPEQLAGDNIPLEARIMALADVFDALVSKRCYKEKMTYDEAFKIIEESLGEHFDPELGRVFMTCREELERYYDSIED